MDAPRKLIFGAGGVAREVSWLIAEANGSLGRIAAFVVPDDESTSGLTIDGVGVIPESAVAELPGILEAYLAIGIPAIRRKVNAKICNRPDIRFPSVIHPSASMDRRDGKTAVGQGVVIYPMASLTSGISIGDFVQINPCATIGHGARIGRFTTICPGSNISGEVTIGEGCFIGAGAVIKEGVRIADDCTIGAGAVVVRDITEAGTWAGVPARPLASR